MTSTESFLLEKARNYCAYQERCIYDVEQKLISWKAAPETIVNIIRQLEDENYINEERYAVSFAMGKLRNNKWGRNKIFHALSQKNIPELYIQMGLSEIDEEEYIQTLKKVLSAKKVTGENEYQRNNKLVKYAFQKGFQPELTWKILRKEI